MSCTVEVIHSLPHRLRLKLSLPLKKEAIVKEIITSLEGVTHVSYTPITKTVLIVFDTEKQTHESVLEKLLIGYSVDNDLCPITLKNPVKHEGMSIYAMIAAAVIGVGYANRLITKRTGGILDWLALGTTGFAVAEQAWTESKRGQFEPELLSVFFLANSAYRGTLLGGSALTWSLSFGKYLLNSIGSTLTVNVEKKVNESGDAEYTLIKEESHRNAFLKATLKQLGMGDNSSQGNRTGDGMKKQAGNGLLMGGLARTGVMAAAGGVGCLGVAKACRGGGRGLGRGMR